MHHATPRANETASDPLNVVPRFRRRGVVALMIVSLVGVGCGSSAKQFTAAPPALAVDPLRAEPSYWLAQPATATVFGTDFDRLWNAAERVSENYLFAIDRRDRREGVLTTAPVVSAQWFEPWRRELQTTDAVVQSSVATLRRSIRWSFSPVNDGYAATPKVLIERQSLNEERVSGVLGRGYFQRQNDTTFGTPETDRNVLLPENYWYAVGRDVEFERLLSEKLRTRLSEVAAR